VLQDDANFLALVDPGQGTVDALALPRGAGCARLFDDTRGNKGDKLDLEACLTTTVDGGPAIVAFGSGSMPARDRILVVRAHGKAGTPEVRLSRATPFYRLLRASIEFSGSELNIEGVALASEGLIRFFQRGNGAPRAGQMPVDATCDVEWRAFWSYLQHGGDPPPIGNVVSDGEVIGTAVGMLDRLGHARWTPLRDGDGQPLRVKAEGTAMSRTEPARAYLVVDSDSPTEPAELLDVVLEGPWLP